MCVRTLQENAARLEMVIQHGKVIENGGSHMEVITSDE